MRVINPKKLAAPGGYSHGIQRSGNLLFIAGQIGWDQQEQIAEGFAAQFELALMNVLAVVSEAGGGPRNIVRMTMFITDKQLYLQQKKEIGKRYRALMGKHYPAMSLLIVKDLLEEGALIEIEATAVLDHE